MTERPDLTNVAPEIRAYIVALEAKVARFEEGAAEKHPPEAEPVASEPPTTVNLITVSRSGLAKRTPRHRYTRQGRGGMGVFDLETEEDDPPALLALADVDDTLIAITDGGRIYRMRVNKLPESPVHARGAALGDYLPLHGDERVIALLPTDGGDRRYANYHIAMLGQRGWVSRVRSSFVGPTMVPGVSYHDANAHGPLVAACWADEGQDLFIASREGQGIRFSLQRIDQHGGLGLRLSRDDEAVAIAAVDEVSGVFLLNAEGQGTIRLMSGFRANKNPGGGGKIAMKTDQLADAAVVKESDDIFVISRLGKIIRFSASEISPKTNPVQGVNCLGLRGDEAVACAVAHIPTKGTSA
jgi:DNA gyrase subunit A